jgi:hypothetical protein
MNKNGIGRAGRRRARQSALAAARAERESAVRVDEIRVTETEIVAAAVHEAAHVVTAFHWDVPIGEDGVSLAPSARDVAGFSDTRWTKLPPTTQISYACKVSSLAGPFAEFTYRDNSNDNFDCEMLISSSRSLLK